MDQDPIGKEATTVAHDGDTRVYAKDLADGPKTVGLFNLGEIETMERHIGSLQTRDYVVPKVLRFQLLRATYMPRLRRSTIGPKYRLSHPGYSRNRQTFGVLGRAGGFPV